MEKRNYVKPLLNSEAFVPQSYVASCQPTNGDLKYYISCNIKGLEGLNFKYHDPNKCGSSTAYEITISPDYKITKLFERPHKGGFEYGCDAYDITVGGTTYASCPTGPISTSGNDEVNLTWKTKLTNGSVYTHQGSINLSQAILVNAS